MAGNKINTKAKGKDDKGKASKSGIQNEDPDDLDFSMLRKPILTSVTGFAQARRIFDLGTEELKDLITNECDLLYECKVCRNIFRSLVNFLSHKRIYCKEKFSSSQHGHFISNSSVVNEFLKIKRMEEGYQESIKAENILDSAIESEDDNRIPLTKDLTAVMENITKVKGHKVGVLDETHQVTLQKIPNTTVAMFQSANCDNNNQSDLMRSQVRELDHILSRDKAVMQIDGKFQVESSAPQTEESEGVIQISDDDDTDNNADSLKCKICNLQFSTQKTLKFHMKYKHVDSRLVYPCPDCVDIFSTSWSVYRHLFKVHRKTAAQIRRLRESIQAKAFKMDNPPAFYEKRKNNLNKPSAENKKISEEERLEQENQAWMENLECSGGGVSGSRAGPRCGGCGRGFERRAALVAHTHTCQPRSRALSLARRGTHTDQRRIEIQIRKDYNKGPARNTLAPVTNNTDTNGNKVPPDENAQSSFKQKEPEKKVLEEATMFLHDDDQLSNQSAKSNHSAKSNQSTKSSKEPVPPPSLAEQLASNTAALRQHMARRGHADLEQLTCRMCGDQARSQGDLCDHVAGHLRWVRYACKLCHCKLYLWGDMTDHVRTVHKLRGGGDLYCSTVRALGGSEALDLLDAEGEVSEDTSASPHSRRASRCSSESSRVSDDSSSSSARVELATGAGAGAAAGTATGAAGTAARGEGSSRKRKMKPNKIVAKKKKDPTVIDKDENEDSKDTDVTIDKIVNHIIFGDADSANVKTSFEENSSDLDDLEEKLVKRMSTEVAHSSVAARRPVRKRTKPKNEDFEYDLSNLLKMEAQGYRESKEQVTTTKTNQTKKKPQTDTLSAIDNKDFVGALLNMSKKSVEVSAALIKPLPSLRRVFNIKERVTYPFAKPMLPKTQNKEKVSPKKDPVEEKDSSSDKSAPKTPSTTTTLNLSNELDEVNKEKDESKDITDNEAADDENTVKPNKAALVPIKFRRQSLELMKNPIINKNISELSKAGMKTKILVIKPINRNKDGTKTVGSPLKFQTIKLKDHFKGPNKTKSDQVMVVKMPTVPPVASSTATKSDDIEQLIKDDQDDVNELERDDEMTNAEATDKSNTIDNKTGDKTNETESVDDKMDEDLSEG